MVESERWDEVEGKREFERYLVLKREKKIEHLRTCAPKDDMTNFSGLMRSWTAEKQIFQDRCCGVADAIDKAHAAVGGRAMTPTEIAMGAAAFAEDEETARVAKILTVKFAMDEAVARKEP